MTDMLCNIIPDLPTSRQAVQHVLLDLQELHAVQAAHTDVRWPNLIQSRTGAFFLIDLEAAVPLGKHMQHCNAWTVQQMLVGAWGWGLAA